MELDPEIPQVAELVDRDPQLCVDLVDDRAGAAGALVVHRRNLLFASALGILLEDDDLRVLTTELDDRVHFGVKLLDGERNGGYFLHELPADERREGAATGSGHEDAAVVTLQRQVRFHALKKFERLLRLFRFVSLIVRPDDLIGGIVDRDRLDGRRTDVEANQVIRRAHSPAPTLPRATAKNAHDDPSDR